MVLKAALGVYLHGLCGDLAAAEKGKRSMLAGDIIEYLPKALAIGEEESDIAIILTEFLLVHNMIVAPTVSSLGSLIKYIIT